MVSGKRENRPSETPWCREAWGNTFQVFDTRLYNGVLRSITQCDERNRGVVSVRRNGFSIDNSIARVPSPAWTGAILKHLNSAIDTQRNSFQTAASTRELLEGKDREGRGYNPADRIGNPGPAVLVWVEANMTVNRPELPFPEPIGFFSGSAQQPIEAFQSRWNSRHEVAKSNCD